MFPKLLETNEPALPLPREEREAKASLSKQLLSCVVVAPAVIAAFYTAGLAVVVADVYLLDGELLRRAPRLVGQLAQATYRSVLYVSACTDCCTPI